jgi:hypothetical protein
LKVIGSLPASSVCSHSHFTREIPFLSTHLNHTQLILPGHKGSLVAVRNYGHRRYLTVIYREVDADDGFIITAFFTDQIDRKKALWKQQ